MSAMRVVDRRGREWHVGDWFKMPDGLHGGNFVGEIDKFVPSGFRQEGVTVFFYPGGCFPADALTLAAVL